MTQLNSHAVLIPPDSSRAQQIASALPLALVLAFAVAASSQQVTPPGPPDVAPQPSASVVTTPSAQRPAPSEQPSSAAPDAAQQPASPVQAGPAGETSPQGAPPSALATPTPVVESAGAKSAGEAGGISEDELKQMLVGKPLFLRGGYLFDQLSYNELGVIIGRSPVASYTLCGVRIDKVHLTKHKLELEGERYGLHFLGAMPYEDPTKAMDRVRITPKKKVVRITIDRELVIKAKKVKETKATKGKAAPSKAAATAAGAAPVAPLEPPGATLPVGAADVTSTPAPVSQAADRGTAEATAASEPPEMSGEDQTKAEIAAAPPAERPADPGSVTWTLSPAHATKILKEAINNVFAFGLDDRMMAAMPDFWKLYYEAAAAKTDYKPSDPAVQWQSNVDQKARLLSTFEPGSNQYAQDNGVAGIALYHVVVGPDGAPGEIAVARPIGFGLDENAVTAIKAAKFQPAIKDGKPVSVLLDLIVQFRIYSHRTEVTRAPGQEDNPAAPILPGPYTAEERRSGSPRPSSN